MQRATSAESTRLPLDPNQSAGDIDVGSDNW
jgi:hypothetical protein